METELKIVRQKDIRRKIRERFLRPRLAEMTYWKNIKRLGVEKASQMLTTDISTRELKAWTDLGRDLGRSLRIKAQQEPVDDILWRYYNELAADRPRQIGPIVAACSWAITAKRAQALGSRGFIFRGDPNWEGLPSLWTQLPYLTNDYIIPTEHILRCWPEPVVPDKL